LATYFNTCIVVPCYNESKNFAIEEYGRFLDTASASFICFVNDGSTDNTLAILESIKQKYPNQTEILSLAKNSGKAEAVRHGVVHCINTYEFRYIAYLDADLSVSLTECAGLTAYLNNDIIFAFGSRIMRIGSTIERKTSRFLIGRIIATLISRMLDLKVYDTQCGCKVFTKEIAERLFSKHFISKWLFDVELFFRFLNIYEKNIALTKMLEVPLIQWIDRGDSKVKLTYFFKLWLDLYRIRKRYSGKN